MSGEESGVWGRITANVRVATRALPLHSPSTMMHSRALPFSNATRARVLNIPDFPIPLRTSTTYLLSLHWPSEAKQYHPLPFPYEAAIEVEFPNRCISARTSTRNNKRCSM